MGALEHGPGPGVEDPAAVGTAIIEDGRAEIPLGVEALHGVAARAAQPGGVKEVEEELIAGIFIQSVPPVEPVV